MRTVILIDDDIWALADMRETFHFDRYGFEIAGEYRSAEEAVRAVWAKYRPKVCGTTMGARGSMCFDGKDFVKCPAFHVDKVVDTTGCGDLFHTGFAVRYLETRDLLDCQRFAAAVSASKCRGLSGRPPAAPQLQEVQDFLQSQLRN